MRELTESEKLFPLVACVNCKRPYSPDVMKQNELGYLRCDNCAKEVPKILWEMRRDWAMRKEYDFTGAERGKHYKRYWGLDKEEKMADKWEMVSASDSRILRSYVNDRWLHFQIILIRGEHTEVKEVGLSIDEINEVLAKAMGGK